MNVTQLGEQASGMLTERATIREAEDLVANGTVDLVVAEDLARIYRNPRHQYNFVQDCVDIGTRVMCIGDNLDTGDENWEITMGAAALRHGLHIPDTRRRVRRTATHCLHKGGMVQKLRYGHRKLTKEEAAAGNLGLKDLRIVKRPECTPIIREMMSRVLRGDGCAAVADWLNTAGVEPGPYVVSRRWSARLVVGLLDAPILSGTRTFRDSIYRPIFKTGKHKPVKNLQPETAFYPDLAHLSAEEHEGLRREIARRRAELTAKETKPPRRQGVPRSRSIWPGQACHCAICGGLMYYVGEHLKCKNALPGNGQTCWNHVQVPARLTRQRVVAWLVEQLDSAPELHQAMLEIVRAQLEGALGRHRPPRDLAREIASLERQAANLAAAIAEGGQMQALVQKLRAVEDVMDKTRAVKRAESSESSNACAGPSKRQIEEHLHQTLLDLVGKSLTFAGLMRRIFPEFAIQPVQALDSGQIWPRGRMTFRSGAILEIAGVGPAGSPLPDRAFVMDLFEPPLHIRYVSEALAARQSHPELSLNEIAALLNINHMTVKRAFGYARLMQRVGASELYREVHELPSDASRWRHRPKRRHDGPLHVTTTCLGGANA